MATVNYLYRSTRDEAPLIVRLLFRHNGKDKVFGAKTKIVVSGDYWKKLHNKKRVSDIELINKQNDIDGKLKGLRSYLLESFNSFDNPASVDKKWLENQIALYYNPENIDKTIPTDLVKFIDYYIKANSHNISDVRRKKFITIKNKMERMQEHYKRTIYIKDINLEFLSDFDAYYELEEYAQNTKHRELNFIRTICKYAKMKGIPLHREFDGVKVKEGETINIFLTFEELDKIETTELEDEDLIEARDWLLISCYTGQRISDFLRFTKDMIRVEDGVHLLEFTQAKTKKEAVVPLGKKVLSILEKRNGEFPKTMFKQYYNNYIKIICEKAGINKMVRGKKQINIAGENEDTKIRNVEGNYKKYELVTSHIGRRSFASNNYGVIPTNYITYITGHATEDEFLKSYMKKKNTDIAKEMHGRIR